MVRFILYLWSVLLFLGWRWLRRGPKIDTAAVAAMRFRYRRAYLFYCSSAGEYEQALPLIQRLEDDETLCFLVFFSKSGCRYASKRGEARPYIHAPPDIIWEWQGLFRALRPSGTIVIRHELWPSFLQLARDYAPLYLVNASRSDSWVSLKAFLLSFFTRVYVAVSDDVGFFQKVLRVPEDRLVSSGDSKFDRVLERRQGDLLPHTGSRLLVGSAWPADQELVLQALALRGQGQVLVVGHEPGDDLWEKFEGKCQSLGLEYAYWAPSLGMEFDTWPQAVYLDCLGILGELYRVADLAFVGGGLHHRVHNVLEPAAYGLPVAHGPKYSHSWEAKYLVSRGLTEVIKRPESLVNWWDKQVADAYSSGSRLQEAITGLAGASAVIVEDLRGEQVETGTVSGEPDRAGAWGR